MVGLQNNSQRLFEQKSLRQDAAILNEETKSTLVTIIETLEIKTKDT